MISPIIHYTGNKFRRLGDILPVIGEAVSPQTTFREPFCGSAVVSINVLDSGLCKTAIIGDYDRNIMNLLFRCLTTPSAMVDAILEVAEKTPDDESGYFALRDEYNAMINQDRHLVAPVYMYAVLYVLQCRSFNNQTRFNRKGEWNLPYGKRNNLSRVLPALEKTAQMLDNFPDRNIGFASGYDFEQQLRAVKMGDFVFVDPPYEKTTATYNAGWKKEDTIRLLELLNSLDRRGVNWMFTSTLINRGVANEVVIEFAQDYRIVEIGEKIGYGNSSYHKSDKPTVEVAIVNY